MNTTFVIENKDGTLEYPLLRADICRKFPNVSFPKVMTGYTNPEMGIYQLVETDPPESQYSHVNVQVDPIKHGDHYVQQWGAAVPRPQDEIDAYFNHKISRVKDEANRRILAILPDWKQRNYTARAVEKVAAGEVGDDEWNAMQTAWQRIKAVRVASDAIETEIAALTDEQAGQYDVAASPLWP